MHGAANSLLLFGLESCTIFCSSKAISRLGGVFLEGF